MQASRAIETGDASLTLVGGVESMSRAPWVLLKPSKPYTHTDATLHSTTLGWRMVNPEMPEQWTISLGASAEKLADIHDISREAQDEFAVRSHRLAHQAWEDGFYDPWVVGVPDVELERDEGIRPDSSPEKLATLRPAFAKDGTVTAGNASPLNDGAGAMFIGDEAAGKALGQRADRPDRRARDDGRRPRRVRHRARRGDQPRARARRASAGATSRSSSSTRRSRRRRSPA